MGLLLAVAPDGQFAGRDLRLSATYKIGDNARGTAGHGPAKRPMPRIQMEIGNPGRPQDRWTIRSHRAQTAPEGRTRKIAPFREEIRQRALERRPAPRGQPDLVIADLGRAANADTIAKPGDRDLVGLVHYR